MTAAKTCPVITISREYGAGGRTVAKALAEKLDLNWYDKDLVREAARESGYTVDEINREGEELSKTDRFLDALLNNANAYTSSHDGIYRAQKETILNLAAEPCIIVGRCANIILKEANIPSFHIFLYSSNLDARVKRAGELIASGADDLYDPKHDADVTDIESLKKYVHKRDQLRDIYYNTYTKHTLGDYHDYDVVINTALVSTDEIVDLLIRLIPQA